MDLPTVIGISVALGMDCFAVCIAAGTRTRTGRMKIILLTAALFGFFQAGMTLAGWGGGTTIAAFISSYDHWIAALLLWIIGGKMIQEGIRGDHVGADKSLHSLPVLLILAIATSIDALAVGFSFAILDTPVFLPALVIGTGSVLMSLAGFWIGDRFGSWIGTRAEILGGVILVLIGINLLSMHFYAGH